jgi:hypothetical protein
VLLSARAPTHNIKIGITYEQTFLTENDGFGIVNPGLLSGCASDPMLGSECSALVQTLAPYDLAASGQIYHYFGHTDVKELAMFAQDTITKGAWSFSLGLRGDFYNGLESVARQAEPRVGIAYNVKQTNTVLRVSYARTLSAVIPRRERRGICFFFAFSAAPLILCRLLAHLNRHRSARPLRIAQNPPSRRNIVPPLHASRESLFGRSVVDRLLSLRISAHVHPHSGPYSSADVKCSDRRILPLHFPSRGHKHFPPIACIPISLAIVRQSQNRKYPRLLLQARRQFLLRRFGKPPRSGSGHALGTAVSCSR